MKKLQVIILFYFSMPIFGQIDNDIFEFENMPFDSIIVYSDSMYNNAIIKETYLISSGNIYFSEAWYNDKLSEVSKYKYLNGNLIKTIIFECKYSFDSLENLVIGEMNYNKSSGVMNKYQNNLVIKSLSYEMIEDKYHINNTTAYKYDSFQRLVEETYSSNYANALKRIDTYKYLSDSVLVKIYFDSIFSGSKIIIGKLETPSEIKSYQSNGELIFHLIYVRDSNGNVIERYYKVNTNKYFGGGTVDFAGYKKTKIKYNESGFPIELKYYGENGLLKRKRYSYYTP